ncbi:membrane protein [Streptomyces capoamus]|uniref:Membrane protein n=1 Tax=Streptomyces capoamus TaxID=68183 RepID=A0A919EXP3_9ACTN|nr:glycosyltransferase 87 family protein [Streptomyces capoamus]GGW18957.1 membrane protein [Streptomyces libani subsp. rufus]GHG56508.1 membrane protein [Streptomyces capoamus]
MDTKGAGRSLAWLLGTWAATRAVLLLFVFRVYAFPGPDVTSDVSVIYRGWYEVLRQGTFPLDDVTWQYPPAAALAVLSPALLPFLSYAHAFYLLAWLADAVVLVLLVSAGGRPERSRRGAWVWVAGVPLLGPTVYARYDVMVTAVAVAALLAGAARPRVLGALTAFGALLKVWPALLLVGAVRRRAWGAAAVTAAGLALVFTVAMPGAFAFLTFQRDRGTEVESLGALAFHVARHFGWQGQVLLNYGSIEFLGPHVDEVSSAALALTGVAFGWLLLWRLRAARFAPHTLPDAALTAVLLFTVTSRVISPQYLVWLVGLAAVCLAHRASRMGPPALLVVLASFVTVLEFPLGFSHVVLSDWYGVALLAVRNGLLVAATLTAARRLWRATVPRSADAPFPPQATRAKETPVSS